MARRRRWSDAAPEADAADQLGLVPEFDHGFGCKTGRDLGLDVGPVRVLLGTGQHHDTLEAAGCQRLVLAPHLMHETWRRQADLDLDGVRAPAGYRYPDVGEPIAAAHVLLADDVYRFRRDPVLGNMHLANQVATHLLDEQLRLAIVDIVAHGTGSESGPHACLYIPRRASATGVTNKSVSVQRSTQP